jgi:hypothetical protein
MTDRANQSTSTGEVDDLAMLVRMLVHSLKRYNPNSGLAARASDYLRRHGLQGSPLRLTQPQDTP